MTSMVRTAAAAALLAALGGTAASAATLASFSTQTSAKLWLRSAYLSGTKVDAFHLLRFEYDSDYHWEDDTDAFSDVLPIRVPGLYGFGLEGISQGVASAAPHWTSTHGAAAQDVIIDTGDWCEDDTCGPIELTFGYKIAAKASSSVARSVEGDATASAGADIFVRDGSRTSVVQRGVSASITPGSRDRLSNKMVGRISFTLLPFSTVVAGTEIGTFGEIRLSPPPAGMLPESALAAAPAPAPVPLPAGLPLLGAGLAALAALRARRRARS